MPLELRETLARHRLFRGMEPGVLDELAASARFVQLRGGVELFAAGSEPDSLFLVVTGRLRADLGRSWQAEIGVGESVGEIGILAGSRRMARVVAMRDSLLLRIESDALLASLNRHPQAMLALSRVVIQRLQSNRSTAEERERSHITTLAVLETRPGRGQTEAVRRLKLALARYGQVEVIDEAAVDRALGAGTAEMPYGHDQANMDLVHWLNRQETQADYLIYTATGTSGAWLRRCLRQADHVLLLADAGDAPARELPLSEALRRLKLKVPVSMLLRRSVNEQIASPLAWREALGTDDHFYWHAGRDAELRSLVRQLTGHGIGLVLGGGGARGFAHLGLLRALEELGITVDLLGGSSMGAFIAGLKATGLSVQEMVRETKATFVESSFLNDYMLPRVALIRGRRFLGRMRAIFGELCIEELPLPYYCVTTNLSRGRQEVHQSGELALWIATSMAVPGVAPPVAWHGDLLADGAVINALPTDVMRSFGRGPVISSGVSTEGMIEAPGIEGPDPNAMFNWTSEAPRPGLFDILFRTATLTSESGNRARADLADVHLQMPVGHVGMFQWDAIDELVRSGYEHAMAVLSDQRANLIAAGAPIGRAQR